MDGLVTRADLNILPPGSYDVLIGMDWLEAHRAKIYYYNKNFECLYEEGELKVLKDIPKMMSRRKYLTMRMKELCGKGSRGYATHVLEATDNETPRLEDFHVL